MSSGIPVAHAATPSPLPTRLLGQTGAAVTLFGLGGYSGPLTARISFCGAPARSYGALGVDRYHVLRQAEDP